MSNKTTFRRIALAVVAGLGFGVLSLAPSSATVTLLTTTPANGTATTAKSDSSTAGSLSISFTKTQALDTVTVSAYPLSYPTGAAAPVASNIAILFRDTLTSTVPTNVLHFGATNDPAGTRAVGTAGLAGTTFEGDTLITLGAGARVTAANAAVAGSDQGKVAAKFLVWIDTATNGGNLDLDAGTYSFEFILTPYNLGVAATPVTAQVSIVVSGVAAESKVVDPTKSIAVLSTGTTPVLTTTTTDSSISVSSEASNDPVAYVVVRSFNASSIAVRESITVSISNAGLLHTGTVGGSSLTIDGDGDEAIQVRADGRSGVGTITVSTPTKTFAAKTITFFAEDPATVTPSVRMPVVSSSALAAIRVTATDVNKNVWGGQAYIFSADTKIATAGTCTFSAALGVHDCTVTGVAAGQSKFQIGNKSTLATSTVKTDAFDGPIVNLNAAATVKVEFDKAAYAPGEKARIYVTPLDSAGKNVVGGTLAGMLATGGVSASVAFSSGSDTLTATDLVVSNTTSSTTGAKAGSAMYTVYMPFGKGTVTLSATGGTGLPAAGQVALTASASVVDDSVDAAVDAAQEATDAAIAATDAAILAQEAADEAASAAIAAQETAQAAVDAVTALSAEVTKLVAQLATLQKLLNRVAKRVGVKL